MDNIELARIAAKALSDKKGEDIKIIDITGIADFADFCFPVKMSPVTKS